MFKKIFKKENNDNKHHKNVLVTALLIHAAKIDENYDDVEKGIIKKAIIDLDNIDSSKAEEIIKNNPLEYRVKIIEILWKIVYSDGTNDSYETNLIRRVCGLLYVSDKESGKAKLKIKELLK